MLTCKHLFVSHSYACMHKMKHHQTCGLQMLMFVESICIKKKTHTMHIDICESVCLRRSFATFGLPPFGAPFGTPLGLFRSSLSTLWTLQNSQNFRNTLCPTFCPFWGAQGHLQGGPKGPSTGPKSHKMRHRCAPCDPKCGL